MRKYDKDFKNRNITTKLKNRNINKLRKLSNSDPRKYWKQLNGKKQNGIAADLNGLYEFFKGVNYNDNIRNLHTAKSDNNQNDTDNPLNHEINDIISECEIEFAVKNNKASGYDKIVNEHIKTSWNQMKHVYVKLST